MSNEEMDRAIAEHVGARFFTEDGGAFWHFVTSDGRCFGRPTEDLNAMHEAEKRIVDWVFWRIQLSHVVGIGYAPDLDICEDIKLFASSTALQRAEAFLRTIGKWRDE